MAHVAVEIWNDEIEGTAEGEGEYYLIETTALESYCNNDETFLSYLLGMDEYGPDELITDTSICPIVYMNTSEWADYLEYTEAYVIDCSDQATLGMTSFVN